MRQHLENATPRRCKAGPPKRAPCMHMRKHTHTHFEGCCSQPTCHEAPKAVPELPFSEQHSGIAASKAQLLHATPLLAAESCVLQAGAEAGLPRWRGGGAALEACAAAFRCLPVPLQGPTADRNTAASCIASLRFDFQRLRQSQECAKGQDPQAMFLERRQSANVSTTSRSLLLWLDDTGMLAGGVLPRGYPQLSQSRQGLSMPVSLTSTLD